MVAALLGAVGCGSDDEAAPPQPSAFALTFAAVADGKPVGCEDRIDGLGPKEDNSVGLSDLRFYVSNLVFWDDKDQAVDVALDENDFQYKAEAGQVSLVDLTSNTNGTCASTASAQAEGTKRTNEAITGTTLVERVASVSFDLGVPQDLMRAVIADHTPEGAPSPLAEMQWTWASGYRHFVMNFAIEDGEGVLGEGNVHIGSRDCGPTDGLALEDREECGFVNTPQVRLTGLKLDRSVVTVDLGKVLSGLDFVAPIHDPETFEEIGSGPGVGCHSSPMQPDCASVFEQFGLDMDAGSADPDRDVVFALE